MIKYTMKVVGLAWALVAISGLFGCSGGARDNNADSTEVTNIQGARFDDGARSPGVDTTGSEVLPATTDLAAPASAAVGQVSTGTVAHPATAADVPDNIATIPSATPATEPPPPDAVAPSVETNSAPLPTDPAAFEPVSFKLLSSFKYEEPVPAKDQSTSAPAPGIRPNQIPTAVSALDGKNAVIQGWMVPMEVGEDGSVKSFILVKTQPQCCFGDAQAMNEWVDVTMLPGKAAEFNVDVPLKVYGRLEIGEKAENGFVLSVYRMKANRVEL